MRSRAIRSVGTGRSPPQRSRRAVGPRRTIQARRPTTARKRPGPTRAVLVNVPRPSALASANSSNPASQLVGADQRRERPALGAVDKRGAPRPKRARCDSSPRQTGAMPVGGWFATRRLGNTEDWACAGVDRNVFGITDGLVRSRPTITTGALGHPDPHRHAFDQPEVVRLCALGRTPDPPATAPIFG
jgi:hypothetical protein